MRMTDCSRCNGSGFNGRGTSYDDVCDWCGGTQQEQAFCDLCDEPLPDEGPCPCVFATLVKPISYHVIESPFDSRIGRMLMASKGILVDGTPIREQADRDFLPGKIDTELAIRDYKISDFGKATVQHLVQQQRYLDALTAAMSLHPADLKVDEHGRVLRMEADYAQLEMRILASLGLPKSMLYGSTPIDVPKPSLSELFRLRMLSRVQTSFPKGALVGQNAAGEIMPAGIQPIGVAAGTPVSSEPTFPDDEWKPTGFDE